MKTKLVLLVSLFLALGCSGSNFSGGSKQPANDPSPAPSPDSGDLSPGDKFEECKNALVGTGKVDSVSGYRITLFPNKLNLCDGFRMCRTQHNGRLPWPGLRVSGEIQDCLVLTGFWMQSQKESSMMEELLACNNGWLPSLGGNIGLNNELNAGLKLTRNNDDITFGDPIPTDPNTLLSVFCIY